MKSSDTPKTIKGAGRRALPYIKKAAALLYIALIAVLFFVCRLHRSRHEIAWKRIAATAVVLGVLCALVFVKNRMSEKRRRVCSGIFWVLCIPSFFFAIEYSQRFSPFRLSVKDDIYNLLVIFAVMLFFLALTGRFRFSILFTGCLACIFGLANFYLIRFRGSGLLASDIYNIKTAFNVAGDYNYRLNWRCYTLILFVSLVVAVAFYLRSGRSDGWKKRAVLLVSSALVTALTIYIFVYSGSNVKYLKIKMFKPQVTMREHGCAAVFLHSFMYDRIDKPDGYSIEAVKKIASRYEKTSDSVSETGDRPGGNSGENNGNAPFVNNNHDSGGGSSGNNSDGSGVNNGGDLGDNSGDPGSWQTSPAVSKGYPNIIIVMNEAFADLSQVGEIGLSEDCMPFFHSLSEDCVKGRCFVSVCAGGTANTEFEVLTSNSLAFTPMKSSPYQMYLNSKMPSLTSALSGLGYGGLTAVHPFKGSGYRRDKVYPLLGFDTFLTQDDFVSPEIIRDHISDRADYERLIEEYEKFREKSDKPFFLFNVTMQNHSSYDEKWDNLPETITIDEPLDNPAARTYVNLIKQSDDALCYLISYYRKTDDPTIIVFFGDHQPRLGGKFYKKLLENSATEEKYSALRKYFTPFVIWANYDIKEQDDVWVSGNYLASMILDTAGLPKSGYQRFLTELRHSVPVLTQLGYIGDDGEFYKNGDKDSPYYERLEEYHMLTYNNLFDPSHRISGFY